MVVYAQLVVGPAGTGKSTYCKTIQEYCQSIHRTVNIVNLDPAAENFDYTPAFDVRDLVTLEDVMEELGYGPNGGLIYCMEYLYENMEWLKDEVDKFGDDEYIIFDCPGQVELYSHIPIMKQIIESMKMWDMRICSIYLIDATFLSQPMKFISGSLLALSAMIQLELPHINVLTKCDLADKEEISRFLENESAISALRSWCIEEQGPNKLQNLLRMICSVLDDFTMVSFVALDITDDESVGLVLAHADHVIQYGEDLDRPNHPDMDENENDDNNDDNDHTEF